MCLGGSTAVTVLELVEEVIESVAGLWEDSQRVMDRSGVKTREGTGEDVARQGNDLCSTSPERQRCCSLQLCFALLRFDYVRVSRQCVGCTKAKGGTVCEVKVTALSSTKRYWRPRTSHASYLLSLIRRGALSLSGADRDTLSCIQQGRRGQAPSGIRVRVSHKHQAFSTARSCLTAALANSSALQHHIRHDTNSSHTPKTKWRKAHARASGRRTTRNSSRESLALPKMLARSACPQSYSS